MTNEDLIRCGRVLAQAQLQPNGKPTFITDMLNDLTGRLETSSAEIASLKQSLAEAEGQIQHLELRVSQAAEIIKGLGVGKSYYHAGEVYEATERAEVFLRKMESGNEGASFICNKCGYVGDTGAEHNRRGSKKLCCYLAGKVESSSPDDEPLAALIAKKPAEIDAVCGPDPWKTRSPEELRHYLAGYDVGLKEAEHHLSAEIGCITLVAALEDRITEHEALALVNASRQCLLAGLLALKSPEKPA